MKKIILTLLVIVLCAFTPAKKNVRLLMAGDSTMANYPFSKQITDSITGEKIDVPYPYRGWGQMLPILFNANVTVKNYAKSGTSTKSFVTEGIWNKLLTDLKTDDYVVIEFGHNDASDKSDRHTSPEEYQQNLKRILNDVKDKGGIPILCTPVSRRKFVDGKLVKTLQIYSDVVRKLAKSENVLFIDMEKKGEDIIQNKGEKGSEDMFVTLKPEENRNFPKGIREITHFNECGATIMAKSFIEGLQELKIDDFTSNIKSK